MDPEVDDRPLPPGAWRRGQDPEFTRLATITDGVFAIAMTLLVLQVQVAPIIRNGDVPSVMISRLDDLIPNFIAFGVAFALLGRFWMAHHTFFGRLRAFDRHVIAVSLVYLAFVALLPFPASLVGEYEENPVSVIVFALVLSAISFMETVLIVHAHRTGLLRQALSSADYRSEVVASAQPVVIFLVTIPLAFVSTTLTLVSWGVFSGVFGLISRKRPRPEGDNAVPGGG